MTFTRRRLSLYHERSCYGREVNFLSSDSKFRSQDNIVITAAMLEVGRLGILVRFHAEARDVCRH
jgi:hypothetical protein